MTESADVVRRLASAGVPQPPYELLWEAFADTKANPGPDTIGDFLRNFGVQKPLPTLATAMNVQREYLVIRLRSFMEIRNECAHTGSSSKVPPQATFRTTAILSSRLRAEQRSCYKQSWRKLHLQRPCSTCSSHHSQPPPTP